MRTKLAVLIMALALSFAASGQARADDQTVPGVPSTPNCTGQTMAYLAQLGKHADVQRARGIGQLAHFVGLTMAELREIVADYCATP